MFDRFTALDRGVWTLLSLGLVLSGSCLAADNPADSRKGLEFFESKIRPVLIAHCYKCHSENADELQAGLRLDTRDGARAGGASGAAVVPHDPQASLLLSALRYDEFEMPPNRKLPESVIANFEKWIAIGAPDPRNRRSRTPTESDVRESGKRFWAFEPPRSVAIPSVETIDWPRSEIDHFLLARLERENLQPVPSAQPHTLLRRVYFDLIGLPPTPDAVERFEADPSDEALEQVVDRLLASPQFGERWGRHWLDLARFAETNGGDRNVIYRHAWRYRNYVIHAFNSDKPFDQFLREQIAGDLMPADSYQRRDERLIATGFLTLGPKLFMETETERFQMDVVDEQIDLISRSMLGLTVSCARCHDHKFDPIPTRDYYALAGIFTSTEWMYGTAAPPGNKYGHDRPLQPIGEHAQELAGPAEAWKKAVADQTAIRNTARSDRYRVVRNKSAHENKLKMLSAGKTEAAIKADSEIQGILTAIEEFSVEIAEWDRKIEGLEAELAEIVDNPPPFPDYAMAVHDAEEPVNTAIRIRGEFDRHGEVVPRGFLSNFIVGNALSIPPGSSGRLELVQWITSPDHPLTARVAVNRIWQHLFGEGLVRTVDNFGANGEQPTHPGLLDWLALRFQRQGWSTKQMIREIVLSRAYQLSSDHDPRNYAVDPENQLIWRANHRRLEAEPLRDAILSISGVLDPRPIAESTIPTFQLNELNSRYILTPEDLNRPWRTVYLPLARMSLPEMLETFDFADPSLIVGKRQERTMASQQLFVMNSPFMVEHAQRVARQLLDSYAEDDERIERAYLQFFARHPTRIEVERSCMYLDECRQSTMASAGSQVSRKVNDEAQHISLETYAWTNFCQALFASAEFRYLE